MKPKFNVGDKVLYLNRGINLIEQREIHQVRIINTYSNKVYGEPDINIEYNIGDSIEPQWVYESSLYNNKVELIAAINNEIKLYEDAIKWYRRILEEIDLYFNKEER